MEHRTVAENNDPQSGDRETEESMTSNDAISEAAAWTSVSGLAQTALTFWNGFLGLCSGQAPLDAAALSRLTCMIRAVSWVESQHGTGTGTSASVDPMQCANPQDSWWTELTDCSGTQDRFVRGPNLKPNYNACELPANAETDASFPNGAGLSNLATKTAGHNDANFIQLMSYCWGVPFLIWKTNNPAGDPTYQCRDLSRARLVAGAVAYNGGGDPSYEAKINAALDMIGCLSLPPVSAREFTPSAHETAVSVIQKVVRELGKADEPGRPSKFFPNGIELMYVKVEVGLTKVEVRVAGPKAPSELG